MTFWSAGPKCGNYFHAAESGRRWDEMSLSIPDLCPCAIQIRSFELPWEAGFAKNCPRASSAGARAVGRACGAGAVYGASKAAATARSSLRRRCALDPVHLCYIAPSANSRFSFFLELLDHQLTSRPTSRSTPTTPTHDKPSTVSDSVCHGDKGMAWNGVKTARNRGSYDDAMLIS